MRIPVLASLVWAFLALMLAVQPAQALTFPAQNGQRVVDDAHMLSPEATQRLARQLAQLEQSTSRHLVVVTLPSLQGDDIADYGYQLGRAWGIGQKDANNGALFIIAPGERKVRIEVGYGLEGVLTDAMTSVILQRAVLPRFKAGDVPGGIEAGTNVIVQQMGLDTSTAEQKAAQARQQIYEQRRGAQGGASPLHAVVVLLVLGFVILSIMRGGFGGFLGGSGLRAAEVMHRVSSMRIPVLASLVWAFLALMLAVQPAQALTFPAQNGQRVVDDAHVLSPEATQRLARQLAQLEQSTSRQLVVVTLPSLQGDDIADYGYQLGRAWGIGQKGANNGALFIIAPGERKVRIEVGYGLEGVLTDAMTSVILQRAVLPRFKAGDVPGGIEAGTNAIVQQMGLDTSTAEQKAAQARQQIYEQRRGAQGGASPLHAVVVLLVLGFVILSIMRGGFGGFLGGMFLGSLLGGGGRRYDDDGWGGGGGGNDNSGGGGGGGSFGGGGSSGSW